MKNLKALLRKQRGEGSKIYRNSETKASLWKILAHFLMFGGISKMTSFENTGYD